MKRTTISLFLLFLMTSAVASAQGPNVVTVMSKDLTDIPVKEGLMITVEYCPSSAYPVASLSPFGEGGRRRFTRSLDHFGSADKALGTTGYP